LFGTGGGVNVDAVLIGQIARLTEAGDTSAIAKSAVKGSHQIQFLGIDGDAQADLTVHGGPDKAIHHYPRDHYPCWQSILGELDLLKQAGAFGENISTSGLVEHHVCIGDRFRLGTALVEISQGRQPCWKQGHRLGNLEVVAHMVKTQMCGWYYRVIEQGYVAAGDQLTLIESTFPDWTVKRVIALLIAGEGKKDQSAMRFLSKMEILAANWRVRAEALSKA
jgi:MOSC domain-containing protein YiiM